MAKFVSFVDLNGTESFANPDQIIRLGCKWNKDEYYVQFNGLITLIPLDHDNWLRLYNQLKEL